MGDVKVTMKKTSTPNTQLQMLKSVKNQFH